MNPPLETADVFFFRGTRITERAWHRSSIPYNACMAELGYFLNIDKPAGMTSRDVVNRVVQQVRTKRVGHAGTLDPMATGVLVVAVERATRLVEFVQQQPKTYEAEFRLGESSDTDDAEGVVQVHKVDRLPTREEIDAGLREFIGTVEQIPPRFSALKIQGTAAYRLARKGVEVELRPRLVRIDSIEVLHWEYPRLEVRIACGSGTYIRSIARDLGMAFGTGGLMSRLRRTAIGDFRVEQAAGLEELDRAERYRLGTAMRGSPLVCVDADNALRMEQGKHFVARPVDSCAAGSNQPAMDGGLAGVVDAAGSFLGVARSLLPGEDQWQAIKGGFSESTPRPMV
jgi:tRNA pseudouridine55 synthase